jgi:hypothetical protein
MRVRALLLFGLVVSLTTGCGGTGNLAPVSGQVKVDGKPYPNAYVTFQPRGTKGNANPGRGSVGITDNDGRYTLKYDDGRPGAIIGTHIIRITSMQPSDDPSRFKVTDAGSSDGDDPDGVLARRGLKPEVIPLDWNSDSTREFEVKSGGTDKADFDIVSIQALMKKK